MSDLFAVQGQLWRSLASFTCQSKFLLSHCHIFISISSTVVPLGHKSINLIKKEEVNNDDNNNNKMVGSKQCNKNISWRKKFDEPVHETIPQGLLNLSFEQVF
jgi:hypothetical protein